MKIHPNDFVLEGLYLSLDQEYRKAFEHFSWCSSCRHRFQYIKNRGHQPADLASYDEVIDRGQRALESYRRALEKERSEAPGLFVELMGQPKEQRELLLQDSAKFQTWGLFELVIERSLETCIRDPAASEELARLALQISDRLDFSRYKPGVVEDLRARAWGYLANSRRVRSDLQGAEEAFEHADAHLSKGTGDAVERAVLLDLKASLARDRRQFEDALRLLRRAVSVFLQYGHRHRAGRSLLNIENVYHHMGNSEAGIPSLYQALDLIDPEQEPRLLLCARHNLIDDLVEVGRLEEAQTLYRKSRFLYRDFSDAWTQNRRKWLKGRIVRGIGQSQQAESLFLAARDGFIAEGIPYDTALISLELATLYAEQERTADLKRLAEEMVPIFSSLKIHREALAALAFLQRAAEAEKASLQVVTQVAFYLRRAQYDSNLRFEAPEI